jgi:UDPglucose 6-dehydrogenase
MWLVNAISENYQVRVYDPMGMKSAKKVLAKDVYLATSVDDCIEGADLCVIATPWKDFYSYDTQGFVDNMRHPNILDCWRGIDKVKIDKRIKYYYIGVN